MKVPMIVKYTGAVLCVPVILLFGLLYLIVTKDNEPVSF